MSSPDPSTRILDHIVHLTPHHSLEEASRPFKDLGFNVIPGGTHEGGLTANALVIFRDGTYLELIYFTHPVDHYPPSSPERKKRESHPWASDKPGWIRYAFLGNGAGLTSDAPRISDVIHRRAKDTGTAIRYNEEFSGGRKRTDGCRIQWMLTVPTRDGETLPFFCGDVTPRDWRVPMEPLSNAQHPSTALGIAHIRVLTDGAKFDVTVEELTAILGAPPTTNTGRTATWLLDSPKPTHRVCELLVEVPSDEAERGGVGISEVAIWIGEGSGGEGRTPYGKVVLIPMGQRELKKSE